MAIRIVKFLNSSHLLLVLPFKHAFMSFCFYHRSHVFLNKNSRYLSTVTTITHAFTQREIKRYQMNIVL